VLAKCLMGHDTKTGTKLVVELHGQHHEMPTVRFGPETASEMPSHRCNMGRQLRIGFIFCDRALTLTKFGPPPERGVPRKPFCTLSPLSCPDDFRTPNQDCIPFPREKPGSPTFQHGKCLSAAERRAEGPVERLPGGVGTASATLNPDEHSLPTEGASPKKIPGGLADRVSHQKLPEAAGVRLSAGRNGKREVRRGPLRGAELMTFPNRLHGGKAACYEPFAPPDR
jgi:hypothetical protein